MDKRDISEKLCKSLRNMINIFVSSKCCEEINKGTNEN